MCNIMIQSRFRTRKPLDLLLRYITIPLCRLDFIALHYTYFSGVAIIILLASFSIYSYNILFIIVIYIFSFTFPSYSHQYASTRFTKDAFNGLLLLASPPMLNHPERHKRCFIIGLKGTRTENVPNAGNKLKAIMELPDSIADGVISR